MINVFFKQYEHFTSLTITIATEASNEIPGNRSEEIEAPGAETTKSAPTPPTHLVNAVAIELSSTTKFFFHRFVNAVVS